MSWYIATNSYASSVFMSSASGYISSKPEYFAGRVLAGPMLGIMAKNPIWSPGSFAGDFSYTANEIDIYTRNLILGY